MHAPGSFKAAGRFKKHLSFSLWITCVGGEPRGTTASPRRRAPSRVSPSGTKEASAAASPNINISHCGDSQMAERHYFLGQTETGMGTYLDVGVTLFLPV